MCTSSTKGRLPSSRRRDDVQRAARLQAEPILRDRRALVKQSEQIKLQFLELVVGDLTGQVLSKDATLTEAALIAYCRQQLTGYKTPRQVEFRDTLPKTNIGKILRRELREQAQPVESTHAG